MSIQIYLKTMAGDLFPLEVEPSTSLTDVAKKASSQFPEQFPSGRTKVLLEEEQKELEAEQVLVAMVLVPYRESGVFPVGSESYLEGQSYVRYVIPFRGESVYVYLLGYVCKHRGKVWCQGMYGASLSPDPADLILRYKWFECNLTETMQCILPDVSPHETRMIREITTPYFVEVTEQGDFTEPFRESIQLDEPIACGCGSVVKHIGMKSHLKTKKHVAWLKTQQ
jgi:hypothetical protein